MQTSGERTPGREDTSSLLLEGRFLKHQCLHQQGALQTWRGKDLVTRAPVVVKTAPLHALKVGAFERMLRDDDALRELHSPWLSPPLHSGLQGEWLFRVSRDAPTGTLAERLSKGPLSLQETLLLGRGLLRALREAHAQRVPHRHLKPSNVVIAPEGTFEDATLIDFGLALEDLREPSLLALPLTAIQHLAPEQLGLVTAVPGPASDLYAVGLMLFESLAGALPFPGETLGRLLRQHLRTVPELRARGLSVPRALEQVVQHLLREEPCERYQSAEGALRDLEEISSELARGLTEPAVVVGRTERHLRLTEPSFIGRAPEVEALEGALSSAARGQGGLVFVEGASGGGKTMLLDELARRGLSRGARVFRGQALDRAAPQPLQTLMGVLQDLASAVKRTPALAKALSAGAGTRLGAVCAGDPELRELLKLPVVACQAGGPEGLGEGRAVRALAAVLDVLGDAETPALVLLDDCQWSDELTLKLLASLSASAAEVPGVERFFTVVAAFRTEAVPEGHPLRRMAPMLRVPLAPLAPPDVQDLVESMAGRLPDEAMEVVVRLSEGNPFMAAAIVRGLVESGALEPEAPGWRVVPERLAEVRSSRRAASLLLGRLALLSEEARSLLAAGAILGREFEVDLAAVLAQRSPEQAAVALEDARQRHLLWAVPPMGRYTFAHDRIREALLEQLPAEEQRALHLTAALELERRAPEGSFELAWHFEAAGAPERAWPHALKSAEVARSKHTLDVAERYYRLADRGAVEADDATKLVILEGLGDVLRIRGSEEAEPTYARAQCFATTRLDRARIEGHRSKVAFTRFEMLAGYDRLERALRLIGQRVPAGLLSRAVLLLWALVVHMVHALLLKWRARPLPPLEGEALLAAQLLTHLMSVYSTRRYSLFASWWAHMRGLNIAERHAPSPELATAYANQGATLALSTQAIPWVPTLLANLALARGRTYFQRALALREEFGDAYQHADTQYLYQVTLLQCARYAESVEAGLRSVQLRERAGASHEWRVGNAQYHLGIAFYMMGDLTAAVAQGQAQYRTGRELDDGRVCGLALALWSLASDGLIPGEVIAAELSRPVEGVAYGPGLGRVSLLLAEGGRLLRVREPGQAVAVFEQAMLHLKDLRLTIPMLQSFIQAQRVGAIREQAAHVPSWAFSVRAGLLSQARAIARSECRRPQPLQNNLASIFRELGLIAAMEGRNARARRYFGRSLAIAERLGMHYERARTLLARAQVGAVVGWPEAAMDAADGEEALRPMRAALEPATVAEAPASLSLVDRFPRILAAGRTIASALTREAVISAVREAVSGLLRGEDPVLVEVTPEGSFIPAVSDDRLSSFMRRALELGRPFIPSTEELERAGCVEERSVLCAPILVRGEVAAVFRVTNHKLAGAFGPEELPIAEYIATLAGAALENARGFSEVNALSEERERLYQQAQAALRKRDEFLAVASHELRTPFTPMRLYMQGLLGALKNPTRAANVESWVTKLETANARLQRLAKLVEDLFDVSRMSEGRLPVRRAPVDLAALTVEAVDRWKDELARVKCEYTLEAPEPVVGSWDGVRLEQVLDNLLGNAMKYGPGKPIHVSIQRHGEHALLVVRDEGMGIAPEDQPRIFEKFERAVSENYGGFGLGLWISREVVRGLGGRILVDSMPGQGATFTVELPLAAPPGP
ncbi:ATP-binding protein [Pyxidicoccus caerfyrddinensis]|uniref:ATP-binding protein n=1 Tax=Pyxidicoccus caerfyrddinensis TaxID=2709663 RepID=UPI0013DC3060|nr:ATP-binding protein [Pyxidicoccus caerfyrddinensis]